jgi:hypothetical protein
VKIRTRYDAPSAVDATGNVELVREGLHRSSRQVVRAEDHGERVARERLGGEHVDDAVVQHPAHVMVTPPSTTTV